MIQPEEGQKETCLVFRSGRWKRKTLFTHYFFLLQEMLVRDPCLATHGDDTALSNVDNVASIFGQVELVSEAMKGHHHWD